MWGMRRKVWGCCDAIRRRIAHDRSSFDFGAARYAQDERLMTKLHEPHPTPSARTRPTVA